MTNETLGPLRKIVHQIGVTSSMTRTTTVHLECGHIDFATNQELENQLMSCKDCQQGHGSHPQIDTCHHCNSNDQVRAAKDEQHKRRCALFQTCSLDCWGAGTIEFPSRGHNPKYAIKLTSVDLEGNFSGKLLRIS